MIAQLRVASCSFVAIFGFQLLAFSQEETATSVSPDETSEKVILLNGVFPGEKWGFYSGKKDAKLENTWVLKNEAQAGSYLVCSGQPYGYISTKKSYENFEFGLEWRFPTDENGNSGVLLFTSGDDQIWPKAIQVQLHQPAAGSIFPTQGAKSKNRLSNVAMVSKGVNQWNTCVIRCIDGTVNVRINDMELGQVVECEPSVGKIALQSEGSEVHFRRIWIRELKSEKSPTALKRSKRRFSQRLARQLRKDSRQSDVTSTLYLTHPLQID